MKFNKKSLLHFSFIFILSLLITSCGGEKTEKKSDTPTDKNIVIAEEVNGIHPGQTLAENKCFLCHNASTPLKSRVAPPMITLKARYMKEFDSKAEFIEGFAAFVKSPSKDKALLKGAVDRFGVMPAQAFDDTDVKKIAEYLYDYQIEEPAWFKEHWNKDHGMDYKNTGKPSYKKDANAKQTDAERGLSYALGTKKILGKNLMGTIQKKGTLAALQFCNLKAYNLVDSMSNVFDAKITRVSDKPRNQKNQANAEELGYIAQFKELLASHKKMEAIVKKEDGKVRFYYPIKTNTMCLQCHGTPGTNIKKDVLNELAKLYPADKAQGYAENQIRGIWSIEFDEK